MTPDLRAFARSIGIGPLGDASVQETLDFYRKNIPEYAPNRP